MTQENVEGYWEGFGEAGSKLLKKQYLYFMIKKGFANKYRG
jgi:hypothetical protein